MLRITVREHPKSTTLKLEGWVTGIQAQEFERAWRDLAPALGAKKFRIDLCGVMHMDENGRRVLAEIHGTTGADFLADTPMTKYFAEEARRQGAKSTRGGS
jgi:anti-anti-sigma regulatory factor